MHRNKHLLGNIQLEPRQTTVESTHATQQNQPSERATGIKNNSQISAMDKARTQVEEGLKGSNAEAMVWGKTRSGRTWRPELDPLPRESFDDHG